MKVATYFLHHGFHACPDFVSQNAPNPIVVKRYSLLECIREIVRGIA
jgi:hypothetical protein